MPITAGTRLGPYEIVSALGAGGMGEVYRGRDTRLDRTVAVNVLAPALARDAQFRERFTRDPASIRRLLKACLEKDAKQIQGGYMPVWSADGRFRRSHI